MSKKILSTAKAPSAVGPYSQGIAWDRLVFASGQLPIDPKTSAMPESVAEQARISLENVKAVLESGGSSMRNVLKTTCFLTSMKDFAEFNTVYASFFPGEGAPARACVAVAELPKGAKVEVEAIAFTDK